jgi:hypothetical protein
VAPEEVIVVDDGLLTGPWQACGNLSRMKFGVTQPNEWAAAALVPSAGDTANPDELRNDPEAQTPPRLRSGRLAPKRRHLQGPAPAALNSHGSGLPVIATDLGSLRNDIMKPKTDFFGGAKNPG